MSLDEFYSLCPIELDAIFDSYDKDERERKEWERLLTYILFNAQGGSENVKGPKDLIEFPWEDNEIEIPTDIDWDELHRKYTGGRAI